MGKCPLVGWEKVKLSGITAKELSLAPAKAVVMALARDFIANPILSAAIDVIETGQDISEAVITAGSNLIDSINQVDWLAYAVSATAQEIYEVTQREITLMTAIRAIVAREDRRSASEARYAKISAEAVRNVVLARALLRDAADADRFTVLYRYFNRALNIAQANHQLLSADAVNYLKNKSVIGMATQINESVTEGKIKQDTEEAQRRIVIDAVSGATGIIRNAAMEELDKAVIKIARVGRIAYMYAGINYSAIIYEAKTEIDDIMRRLEVSITGTITREAYPVHGESALSIDEAISKAAQDITKIRKKITGKIKQMSGYYLLSMSPDFNPGSDLFALIDDNNLANTLANSKAASMLLNIAPYSDTANNSLTIYGSNLKLPLLLDALKLSAAALTKIAGDISEQNEDLPEAIDSIQASLLAVSNGIEIEPYVFDNALGMSVARLEAGNLKSKLANMRKTAGIDRVAQKINNEDYINKVKQALEGGLEKKIHEPALGLALLLGYCLKVFLPAGVSKSDRDNLITLIDDRLDYLRGLRQQVAEIKDYRDLGCEAVVDDLTGSGLGFVAEAVKYGEIATGAVSLAAGIGGLAKTIYDVASSCLPLVPDAQRYKDVQKGVKNVKEEINKSIKAAVNDGLKPLGIPGDLINRIKITAQESQRLTDKIVAMSNTDVTALDL